MDGQITKLQIGLSIFLMSSMTLIPNTIEKYRVIQPQILNLKISKNSPPLAILEDEKIFTQEQIYQEKEVLESGRDFVFNLQEKINPQIGPRKLSGLKLDKKSPNVIMMKKIITEKKEEEQSAIEAKNEIGNAIAREVHVKDDRDAIMDYVNLAPHLVNRLQMAEGLEDALNEVDQAEFLSFEQVAASIIEKESKEDGPARVAQPKTYSQRKKEAERIARNFSKNKINEKVTENNTKDQENFKQQTPKQEENLGFLGSDDEKSLIEQKINQAHISGTIVAKDYILKEDSQVLIYRKIASQVVSEGTYKSKEKGFEIYIEDPTTGTINVEIWESNKKVAEGSVLLPEVFRQLKNREALKKLNIETQKINTNASYAAASVYGLKNKQAQDVKINSIIPAENKVYDAGVIRSESSVYLQSTMNEHWGNISLGAIKDHFALNFYPEKTIQALYDLTSNETKINDTGVIWGTIKVNGKEVEGAEVEIVSSEQHRPPVYFDFFIPREDLKLTTKNGQFAFVGLPEGNYIIRAKYKNKYLSPQITKVEKRFVSQVDFDVGNSALSEVFIFDVVTSQMMPAKLNFIGASEFYEIPKGNQLISFSGDKGIQIIEVTPFDPAYYSTRTTVRRSQKEILLPLVPQAWLQELSQRLKMNYLPDSGLIMGLNQEENFVVKIDPEGVSEETRTLYFDEKGSLLSSNEGKRGGGFLIINAKSGIRSIVLQKENRPQQVQTVFTDSSAITILNH